MNYRTINHRDINKRTETEDFVVHHFDRVIFIPDEILHSSHTTAHEVRENVKRDLANQLVQQILENDGIEFLEEQDYVHEGVLMAGRCKWMIKKRE